MKRVTKHIEVKIRDTNDYSLLFSLIRKGYRGSITIDLMHHTFYTPKHILLLSECIIKLKSLGCKINVNWYNNAMGNYLMAIGIREFTLTNYEQPKTIKYIPSFSAMPIRRVERDTMDQYINSTTQYLQGNCQGKDLTFLSTSLAELINNVHDHANSEIGALVFCQFYPNINTVKIAVSDIGQGIPFAVNKFMETNGFKTLSNRECIKWAMKEYNSIVSIPQNRGLGLSNISDFVIGNDSKMELYSDNVLLQETKRNRRTYMNPIDGFIGTLVEIDININKLDDSDEGFIDDDIW